MLKKIRNIAGKLIVLTLVLSVITLNAAGYGHCSKAALSGDCCHVQNTVKPCCVKNIKVTFDERLTAHCGCTMKETQHITDLYIEIRCISSRTVNLQQADALGITEPNSANYSAKFYAPPQKSGSNTYLAINNLRI